MENEYELEVELLPDEDPFELGYKTGALEMKRKIVEFLEDGSECGAFASDVVRSL